MDPPTRTSTQRQPSFAPFLLLLLFYFFLSSPPPAAQPDARLTMQRALARRTAEVEGLKGWINGTAEQGRPDWEEKWREVGGNLTRMWNETRSVPVGRDVARLGKGAGGQEGWDYIRDFVEQEERQRTGGLYLRNITGFLKGQWSWSQDSLALFPDPSNDDGRRIHRRAPISDTAIKDANISAHDWNRGWFPWTQPNATTPNRPGVPHRAETMGGSGRVALNIREGWQEDVREDADIIRGSMAFIIDDWGSELNLDVEGVHFFDNGSFYLQAWPDDEYLDTRSALGLALDGPLPSAEDKSVLLGSHRSDKQTDSEDNDPRKRPTRRAEAPVNGTAALNVSLPMSLDLAPAPTWQQRRIGAVVVADLERRVNKIRDILESGAFPESSTTQTLPLLNISRPDAPPTIPARSACSFLFYGFLSPLPSTYPAPMLVEYESSLLSPTGASTPSPPPPELSGLLVSENCGLVIKVEKTKALLAPLFWEQGRIYAWVTGIVVALQVWLLTRQMDARQSPAACSQISYPTILMQIGMDACIFSNHLTLAIMTDEVSSLPLLIPAFFACISAVLFGMRYSTLVRMYAPPDRPAPLLPAPAVRPPGPAPTASPVTPAMPTGATVEGPLLPITTVPNASRRPDNEALYIFAIPAIGLVFTIAVVYIGFVPLLMTALFSYWVPQIVHNVKSGSSRRGLRKEFIIGTTLCRLYLPLYFWGCPTNVLFAQTTRWIWLLAAYSLFQAGVLCLQDLLGPRFFLPGRFFPAEQRWDYHPSVPPSDIETPGKVPVCNICFEGIDVPAGGEDTAQATTPGAGDGPIEGLGRTLNRWSYMVPPCHHISHTKCLESWMAIKLECPSCRRPLPPV